MPEFDWDTATNDDRNRWVAENVMCWKFLDRRRMGWGDGPPVFDTGEDPDDEDSSPTFQDPQFTSRAAHDYLVLERVRQTWDREQKRAFSYALTEILESRKTGSTYLCDAAQYQPGDFSHAAALSWLIAGLHPTPPMA